MHLRFELWPRFLSDFKAKASVVPLPITPTVTNTKKLLVSLTGIPSPLCQHHYLILLVLHVPVGGAAVLVNIRKKLFFGEPIFLFVLDRCI